ncbi:hypothetical protein [Kribbella sp. NPDC051770]|uniref:hypothetical protein n=1 Tax=Kribbella sp. NPDC051770 TaxID=3155413 RepID=UPI003425B475
MARAVAVVSIAVAAFGGTATAANAQTTGIQAEGEVSCGYDFDKCHLQWFDYGFVKNYIVSKIYYRGGGYHFYWWN